MTHVSRQWAALEADFLRFYGADLGRLLWVERVGCRRLWALMAGLPSDSRFQLELAAESDKKAKQAAPAPSGGWRSLARRMTGAGRG